MTNILLNTDTDFPAKDLWSAAGSLGPTVTTTTSAAQPVFTLDQIAKQLTDDYWTNSAQTPHAFDVAAGGTLTVDLTGLTAEGKQLARWALEAWSTVSGLNFAEVTSGADITFDDSNPGAYAGSTMTSDGTIVSSSVNIGTGWLATYGTTIDSYAFQCYMHEIGHALGLGHAGNYEGGSTYGTHNHYANDSWQMSVMSYFSQAENTFIDASFAHGATPMIADIIAIQALYGGAASSAISSHPGATTYGANSNAGGYLGALFGQISGEDPANPAFFSGNSVAVTIFDTGGVDALDFSYTNRANTIDLRPEGISDIDGRTGNLIIARGTVIENAIGGTGADRITGNAANNALTGGQGIDTLLGDAGNDRLYGGDDNDLLRGGTQEDRLYGEAGNDTLFGDAGFDRLEGGAGEDELHGGAQADNLFGGTGNDTMFGDQGFDRLFGGAGDDVGYGGDGTDGMFGEQGNDTLYGEAGNDRFFGGTGNDLIDGGAGNDTIFGGAGFDTITGGTGNDEMAGNFNADTFVFANGFGVDVITDFAATNNFERIDLSGVSSIVNLFDLFHNHMNQAGGNVVIDALGGNTITLLGVNIGDLDVNDFIF